MVPREIWQVGKLIANNTVHVPLLGRINHNVAEISSARKRSRRLPAGYRRRRAAASGKEG